MPLFACIHGSVCCFLRRGEEGRVKGYCLAPPFIDLKLDNV